jgi:hypothetical protein
MAWSLGSRMAIGTLGGMESRSTRTRRMVRAIVDCLWHQRVRWERKPQLCPPRHGLPSASLPGRPRTVTVGDGLVGVTPRRVPAESGAHRTILAMGAFAPGSASSARPWGLLSRGTGRFPLRVCRSPWRYARVSGRGRAQPMGGVGRMAVLAQRQRCPALGAADRWRERAGISMNAVGAGPAGDQGGRWMRVFADAGGQRAGWAGSSAAE